jgi:probable HAF family extracellular repeat protein
MIRFRALTVTVLLGLWLPSSFAATTASCAFTTFSAPAGYAFLEVDGVSDDGAVVGQLQNTSTLAQVAFIRTIDGKTTLYAAPKSSITWLNGRNGSGVNVGFYLDSGSTAHVHGFVLQGTQFSAVNYPKAINTWVMGINQVGTLAGSFSTSSVTKGFLLNNGNYTVLAYSGAQITSPNAINDNGVVVGSYFNSTYNHGFLWQNAQFTTIDYPRTKYGTMLTGVNNSGLIVGNRIVADANLGFIYQNGVFKTIVYTGAKFTTAGGVNNNGLISGLIDFKGGSTLGYTATCK